MEGYELINVEAYYHQNAGTRPDSRPAYSYYRSLNDSIFNYKGVKVFVRTHLNTDGSHRGYEIIKTSLPYLNGSDLEIVSIRAKIDSRIEEFKKLLNNKPMACEYSICSDGDLYSTAMVRTESVKYNTLERRFILSDLIKKGLPFEQALEFYSNVY